YMPFDRMDEDFRIMKKLGFNMIRIAESTWSTLEPSDGVWNFDYIDRTLAKAAEHDMQVIVGTPTYAIPAWMVRQFPDIMIRTKDGRKPYGARQIMDYMHPEFRRFAERMIRQLIPHVAAHPQVIGYQIDNETKYHDNSSEAVQAMFKEHLKRKFGTVEALNDAYGLNYWSNAIADWDDFPSPDGTINAGIADEYDRFRRTMAADYLQWQADLVSEYKRDDQFITQNFDFEWIPDHSYGLQSQIDHHEAARCLTFASCDIYHPSQADLTGMEIAYGGDSTRCLKEDNSYIVMETQTQAFKQWTPFPGQLKLQALAHLASGARGVAYWNFNSLHNSFESYWKGVLSHDLEEGRIAGEVAEIGKTFRALGEAFGGNSQTPLNSCYLRKNNRVAFVVDAHSQSALKNFPIDPDYTYNDLEMWTYQCLYEMNIECDVVDVTALVPAASASASNPASGADVMTESSDSATAGSLNDRYDMIITPGLYCVTQETVDALHSFVENGGVLVSTIRSFVADDNTTIWRDRAPHGLTDVFGAYYQEITKPGGATVALAETSAPAEHMLELLIPTTAEVLAHYGHKYWSTYAAATANTFGKGRAYYLGTVGDPSLMKNILARARADVFKIREEQMRPAGERFSFPVIVREGETEDGRVIRFIMNFSSDDLSVENVWGSARDLLTGQTFAAGETMDLKDWGVLVLEF
ncbi:MAG: beta-galactosidase, partial [Lachnospiraceae bacterium]|nr:beta-galactosidase [Lachnospiraceae bacterium]